MAVIRPFRAVRPRADIADKIAALPYDVMSSMEAREMVKGNPLSFLYIDRSELNFPPEQDIYAPEVYNMAREVYDRMKAKGEFIQDETPCLYLYRQIMDGRVQMGLALCASVEDYLTDAIKKHELTREEKERDRIRHVDALNANTGPIFLTYRAKDEVTAIMQTWANAHTPVYDYVAEDGISHTVWVIDDKSVIDTLVTAFAQIPALYIADGHHRTASAVKVALMRRGDNANYDKQAESEFFLAVVFPDKELYIMDYNRVVKDLNGLTKEAFLAKIAESFDVEECKSGQVKPDAPRTFGMYLNDTWYKLTAKPKCVEGADVVGQLDVSILQDYLLSPILGIGDVRVDKRIDFVGGLRGLGELERRVNSGEMAVAFAMFATTIDELMDIADAGKLMPPKSTWFEPKLRSGLLIHELA